MARRGGAQGGPKCRTYSHDPLKHTPTRTAPSPALTAAPNAATPHSNLTTGPGAFPQGFPRAPPALPAPPRPAAPHAPPPPQQKEPPNTHTPLRWEWNSPSTPVPCGSRLPPLPSPQCRGGLRPPPGGGW
ncbi:WAS/WASL-interacting protein family member 1-like [Molothrus aeneus]|uniref:WAS/WASL-interacting protein family member 1-like n=1 Tax=Molothrus aeneus TaxID=84833 RepID=UPI0034584BFB